MLDLTLNTEDKENFITKVFLKDEGSKLVVQFADSHLEERDFTVQELNAVFAFMEEQYHQYKVDYVKRCHSGIVQATIKSILEALLAVGGIYLTSSISMPDILKMMIIMTIICGSLYFQQIWSLKAKCCSYLLRKMNVVETFLSHKEDFKIKVLDPNTNEIEDWYLLTLSGIDEIEDARFVSSLASSLSDDVRVEESLKTTMALKKKMK